jgi:GxxExxY protein
MTAKHQKLVEEDLTREIIAAFYTVYNALGYGFLESVYANALALELRLRNLKVLREVPVEVLYMGQRVGFYRMDQVVEGKVLIEIKSTTTIGDADRRQIFNYLKASPLLVGLLFHFGPKPAFERFTSPKALSSRS